MIGGILYAALTYFIVTLINLSVEFAIFISILVFLFYLVSRFLLLFSGIHTPYYSKGDKVSPTGLHENTYFCQTAQWVGKFYHDHDMVLFAFLALTAFAFILSLVLDWLGNRPTGDTLKNLLNSFTHLL
jgi:hypothetical protein